MENVEMTNQETVIEPVVMKSQQELEAMELNDLVTLYNEQNAKSADLASKMLPCMLSEDEFKKIKKAISEVPLVQQDSAILMFETIKGTVDELTEFKVNAPWTVRKVFMYDTMLGRVLNIENYSAIKAFNKAFNSDTVKSALIALGKQQAYNSMIMQQIGYKERMQVYTEMHGIDPETEKVDANDACAKIESELDK